MAQISLRIDDTLKLNAERLFGELGVTLSGAVNMFVRQAVRQGGFPFVITTAVDPFFNTANQRWLAESIEQEKHGEVIRKSFEELEAMAK